MVKRSSSSKARSSRVVNRRGSSKARASRTERSSLSLDSKQIDRLLALARRWNVSTDEALRRVLDQAFIGRGTLIAAEGALVFLEHLSSKPKKLEPKGSGVEEGDARQLVIPGSIPGSR